MPLPHYTNISSHWMWDGPVFRHRLKIPFKITLEEARVFPEFEVIYHNLDEKTISYRNLDNNYHLLNFFISRKDFSLEIEGTRDGKLTTLYIFNNCNFSRVEEDSDIIISFQERKEYRNKDIIRYRRKEKLDRVKDSTYFD